MTRILLLHAELGSGHRSAAEALAAALVEQPGVDARVEDALDHIRPLARKLWKEAYRRLSEGAPWLYKAFYDASDAADAASAARSTLRAGRLSRFFLAHIEPLFREYQPDAVVCTMQFPLQLMSAMRRAGHLRTPLYVVVTDFVPHGAWVADGVAAYFVPSDTTAEGFVRKGIDPRLIHVTGVPVRPEVAEPKRRDTTRTSLGIPQDRPVITVFGGGVDPQLVRRIVEQLLAADTPCTLVTVAGRSAGLEAALSDLEGTPAVGLLRLGAIDFVDDLLVASDLLIGKAGGLTTSEALARGVPMIMIAPIPGQEEWNADYVASTGAGIQLGTPEAAAPVALDLIRDPERLALMRSQALHAGRPHAAREIAGAILADLGVALLERAA